MKSKKSELRNTLLKCVQQVEQQSNTELVIVVKKKSGDYGAYFMGTSFVIAMAALAYMLYSNIEFTLDLILAGVVSFFIFFTFLFYFLPELIMWAVPLVIKKRNVHQMAHALFSKAKIFQTQKKTGMLILVSLIERQAVLLVDEGIENAISHEILSNIRSSIQNIFKKRNLAKALHETVAGEDAESLKNIMASYIPPIPNDINELPDSIDIDFKNL
jgi:putative membrane protein